MYSRLEQLSQYLEKGMWTDHCKKGGQSECVGWEAEQEQSAHSASGSWLLNTILHHKQQEPLTNADPGTGGKHPC